jgi:hypothetical protein
MSATWRSLLRDERGFVISAELVLISTVLVLGLAVALSAVKTALAGELSDVAGAIGKVNQTYYTHGFHGHGSRVYGSAFLDEEDSSDELKADFATGIQDCKATALATTPTNCPTPPCVNPPCANPPCATPCSSPCASPCPAPCNGCGPQLPAPGMPVGVADGTPCGSPCGTPCGASVAAPYGTPCSTQVAAGYGAPYGLRPGCGSGGSGSSYQVIEGWSRFGVSVPSVICPPGPGPFTGTDPFAPGAVSPKNMYLQGISYGGVCAPPAAPDALPAPSLGPGTVQPPVGVFIPQTPVVPAAYQYEPAFLPPQGLPGTVY